MAVQGMKRSRPYPGALLLVLGLALLTACGGRSGAVQTGPMVLSAWSGLYQGPNVLQFALTSPVVRQLPAERNYGDVQVVDGGGPTVTLVFRMFQDGAPCRVEAQRTGGGSASVIPGQRCASRFRYDGAPVQAMAQINRGDVYITGGSLRATLYGPFVADVALDGRVVPVEGQAQWGFEGARTR